MAGLVSTIQILTAFRTTATKASADLMAWAAANPTSPLAATALAAAADIDIALQSSDLLSVTETSFDELKALGMAGKGIVHHQATDTFGG